MPEGQELETPNNPAPPKKFQNEAGKWFVDYQPMDETGKPIGRKTHLEADTPEELIEKQQQAHLEATRAYFRIKNAKPEPAKPRSDFQPRDFNADEEFQITAELQQP